MEDGERIARVEVGMEAQTGQLDRMERDLTWLRTEAGKTNERMEQGFARQSDRFERSMEELRGTMERGLAENRRENMANVRWLIALTGTIILAVIGLLANTILRS